MTTHTATALYKWHPAANLFPMLGEAELDALVADIRAEGLHNPIVLHEGLVLDGRNRLLACEKAGVEPRFTEWDPKGSSPTAWVISLNLQRRHLDAGQRAAVAVDARPLLEAEAKKNQRLGGDPSTFVKNDKPRVSVPIDSRQAVAEQFNVSSGYVHAAQKIKDASPQTFEQLKAGNLSLPEAQRQIGMKHQGETPRVGKNVATNKPAGRVEKQLAEPPVPAGEPQAEEVEIWLDDLCQACRDRLFPQESTKRDDPSDVKSAPDQTTAEVNVAEEDILPDVAPDLTYEPADDYEPVGEDQLQLVSTQRRCIEEEL